MRGGAEIQLVTKPKSKLIRVAFNRLQHCPKEISNTTDLKPEQVQSEEQSRKSVNTPNAADNVSIDDGPVDEQHAYRDPVEKPTTSVPVEEDRLSRLRPRRRK